MGFRPVLPAIVVVRGRSKSRAILKFKFPPSALVRRALASVTPDHVESFNAAMRARTEQAHAARRARP